MPTLHHRFRQPKLSLHFLPEDEVEVKENGEDSIALCCGDVAIFFKRHHAVSFQEQLQHVLWGRNGENETVRKVAADQTAIGPPVDVEETA